MLVITADDVGNIIRDRRTDLSLSQAQLAERIGMSRQWIVRFENGHADTATIEHLLALAETLGIDIELGSA